MKVEIINFLILQVTEVFTSGGFLHLLPSNKSESYSASGSNSNSVPSQTLWEVDPHSNKTIVNLIFVSFWEYCVCVCVCVRTNIIDQTRNLHQWESIKVSSTLKLQTPTCLEVVSQ